jgi:hypothetical protein
VKRYSVSLRAVVTREVEIEAESPEEAVSIATTRHGCETRLVHMRAEGVDEADEGSDASWEVMGFCEACRKALLVNDDDSGGVYAGDEDGNGVYLCRPCAIEEAAGEPDPSPETTSGEAS